MPPRKLAGKATISALMGDMSDDELGYTQAATMVIASPPPKSKVAAMPAKARGRPGKEKMVDAKAKSAAASKPAATKAKDAAKSAPTATRRTKRAALEDVTNTGTAAEQDDAQEPPKKRVKATATAAAAKKPAARGRKKQTAEKEIVQVPATQDATEASIHADITEPSAAEETTEAGASFEEVIAEPALPKARTAGRARTASRSRQPEVAAVSRGTAVAANADKGASDAALRRRLGEVTTKYDTLEVKFNNLKEVASVEAQSNFDKLKAAADRQAKSQESLVASLRKQIAIQKDLAAETRALQAQLAASHSENERLAAETKTLTGEIKSLKETNTKSQNDVKALHAKLASSRAASEGAQNSKAANMKNMSMQSNASSQIMALKEDLYCDFTGLIIHSVKRVDTKYVYDCSQTGRNGTLRFHVSIEDQPAMTPGASMIDEPQITYTPLIDEKNDKNLLDILDEYLLEEIEFPSSSIQRLYTKIRDGMMRPVVVVDENSMTENEE